MRAGFRHRCLSGVREDRGITVVEVVDRRAGARDPGARRARPGQRRQPQHLPRRAEPGARQSPPGRARAHPPAAVLGGGDDEPAGSLRPTAPAPTFRVIGIPVRDSAATAPTRCRCSTTAGRRRPARRSRADRSTPARPRSRAGTSTARSTATSSHRRALRTAAHGCAEDDLRRVIIAVTLDSTAPGGTRSYQEIQSRHRRPREALGRQRCRATGCGGSGDEIATFWLTDTACNQTDAAAAERKPRHPQHPRAAVRTALQTGNTRGAPDLMFNEQPPESDAGTGTLYDYATDVEPALNPSARHRARHRRARDSERLPAERADPRPARPAAAEHRHQQADAVPRLALEPAQR